MLSVISGNYETSLDDGSLCLLVGYDGWGMPPGHRLISRGMQQHGDTDLGFRLDPRIGRLILALNCSTMAQMYYRRAELLRLFAPQNALTLKWVLPNGDTRYIDCVYDNDMSLPWTSDDWVASRVVISLKASDPTFYALPAETISFDLAKASAWEIPWEVPWLIGKGDIDQVKDIYYDGTFQSNPIIYIIGPIADARIENLTTNEVLHFKGITISASDVYTVDCRWGHKTVVDIFGTNKIDDLGDENDLATFHLEASNEGLPSKINRIRVSGIRTTSLTNVLFTYYKRYIGI